MNKNFLDFMRKFDGQKMAVGVSGGVDSVALLHWLVEIGADVVCLHVNHNLRPSANTEAQYVQDLCKKLGVECHVFSWDDEKPETGLEDAARVARYKFMTDFCHKNKIKIILTAHQADDQIETFWMNIKYFADEMNDDPHYTRVKIRQNRHLVGDALGISDERVLLAIQNLGRVRESLEQDVIKLARRVVFNGRAMFGESFLFDQSPDIRLKFLGTVIQTVGGDRYQPRLKSLIGALDKLQSDCKFTIGHCTVRRLGDKILIVREGQKTSFRIRKRHYGKKYIKK